MLSGVMDFVIGRNYIAKANSSKPLFSVSWYLAQADFGNRTRLGDLRV